MLRLYIQQSQKYWANIIFTMSASKNREITYKVICSYSDSLVYYLVWLLLFCFARTLSPNVVVATNNARKLYKNILFTIRRHNSLNTPWCNNMSIVYVDVHVLINWYHLKLFPEPCLVVLMLLVCSVLKLFYSAA